MENFRSHPSGSSTRLFLVNSEFQRCDARAGAKVAYPVNETKYGVRRGEGEESVSEQEEDRRKEIKKTFRASKISERQEKRKRKSKNTVKGKVRLVDRNKRGNRRQKAQRGGHSNSSRFVQ